MFERDVFQSLEEPTSKMAWSWNGDCKAHHPFINEDSCSILVQARFAKYYKARRFQDAEDLIRKYLKTHDLTYNIKTGRFFIAISELMQKRQAFAECKVFLIALADEKVRICDWDLQHSLRRLALNIYRTHVGNNALDESEELLVTVIVPTAVGSSSLDKKPLEVDFEYVNPSCPSAFTLGLIYEKAGLFQETAILISWILHYNITSPKNREVRSLVNCLHQLSLLDDATTSELITEAEKPDQYASHKRGTAHQGPNMVLADQPFKDAQTKLREVERDAGRVKARFQACLRRMGRDDLDCVDGVWDTMILPYLEI